MINLVVNRRGSIAVATVMTAAILFILGAGALKISTNNLNSDISYRDGVAAQYLAEAGAQRMYTALMANPNNAIATVTAAKNAGSTTAGTYEANVTVNPANANQLIIYSKGTVNSAVRVIRTTVQKGTAPVGGDFSTANAANPPGPGEGSINFPIATDIGVFSGGNMTVNNNSIISSNTYSNGSTILNPNVQIGKVSAVGSVTVNNSSLISSIDSNGAVVINGNTHVGTVESNASSVTVNNSGAVTGDITAGTGITVWGATTGVRTINHPQTQLQPIVFAPPSSTNTNVELKRSTYSGSVAPPTDNATLNGGNYYLNGSYVANNNVNIAGDGIIYIVGNVTFNNKATFTGNVTLLVEGSVTFHNTASFANMLIMSGGGITFNNNLYMNGALLTNGDLVLNNNTSLIYTPSASTTIISYTNQ